MTKPWSAERELTEAQAARLIGEQFPQLLPLTVKFIGAGFDNCVFQVNERYVFRFPRKQGAVELLRTECRLLPVAAALRQPLSIAAPRFHGEPTAGFPWLFAGFDYVAGECPGWLSRAERMRSAQPLAEFLRALHQFPAAAARELGVPDDQLGRVDIPKRSKQLADNIGSIAAQGLCSGTEAQLALEFLRELQSCEPVHCEHVLLHGDLHIRNVLTGPDSVLTGVIDWGDAHVGHPAVDLSILYMFLPREGREAFYSIYGEISPSTERLARMKALNTSAFLLLCGHDRGDASLVEAARESLRLALER